MTAHAGARLEHAEWQGKVYSRSGKSKKYPSLVDKTGYGTGPGLGGWNCRHSMFPFFENISKRSYTDEELEDLKPNKESDIIETNNKKEVKDVQNIGKLDKNKLGKYKDKMMTDEVVLTKERLEEHILVSHKKEYEQLVPYLKSIIEQPDIILDDNRNKDTVIILKNISEIGKNGRVVVKIAVAEDCDKHPKNSIITLMKLNDRTWKQTLKNRGNIIFKKSRQK